MAEKVNRIKEIPQTDNSIEIEGTVLGVDIEEKEIAGQKAIAGKVTIDVNGGKHEVNLFSYKYKKESRDVSANFKAYETVRDEYQVGDKVRTGYGTLSKNEFFGRDGNLVSAPQIGATFLNRIKETDVFEPKAKFAMEIFLTQDAKEEVDKEENETGRAIIKGLAFAYQGFSEDKAHKKVFPVEFIVENPKAVEYVLDNYQKDMTVKVYGNIESKEEITREEIEVGFGEPEIKEYHKTVTRYVVTGGSEPMEFDEDDESTKGINPKLVKRVVKEREEALKAIKDKAQNSSGGNGGSGKKDTKKSAGRGQGFGDEAVKDPFGDDGRPLEINEDDLPF